MEIHRYGVHEAQYYRMSYPAASYDEDGKLPPIIILFHGGFWKEKYSIDNASIDTVGPYFVCRGRLLPSYSFLLMFYV